MKKCISLANIDAQVSCQDNDNVGGIIDNVIYGYWDDVETWPDFPAPAAGGETPLTLDAAGTLDGDVVMKAGTCAYKLEHLDETGHFDMTDQGEQGSESVLYQLDIIRNKMTSVVFGFMNATRGRKMFFIVTDKNGNSYLMGDKLNAARRIASDAASTGTATTDRNSVPMRFTYTCPRNLVYTGDKVNILTARDAQQ